MPTIRTVFMYCTTPLQILMTYVFNAKLPLRINLFYFSNFLSHKACDILFCIYIIGTPWVAIFQSNEIENGYM